MMDFKEELKKVPEKPGVYLMHNAQGVVIYVGKAIILRNRLRSYFNNTPHNARITKMISNIDYFEFIVTDSEYEALMLECTLIKKYRPKYNVLLKDDKNYPYIKVTLQEEFPRVFVVRKAIKDGAKYFGPYYSGYAVNSTVETLSQCFPLRTCRKNVTEGKTDRVCLNYHIGLCPGPCAGYISKADYHKNVDNVCDFLSGKSTFVIKKLNEEMAEAAGKLDFEKAAELRDRVKALQTVSEKQKVLLADEGSLDIIAVHSNATDACIQIFFVRAGKIAGRDSFIFEGVEDTGDSELVLSFIEQFYQGEGASLPGRLYVRCKITDEEISLYEEMLSKIAERKVKIIVPERGEKKQLADMAAENAEIALNNFEITRKQDDVKSLGVLEKLKDILNISKLPLRIESFDISNLGDSEIDGSMVVFTKGKPDKGSYKRYKIKGLEHRSDVDSMNEMLTRRYTRLKNMDAGFDKIPDLILMDGGMQQVREAIAVLQSLEIRIPIFGMVKNNKHRSRGLIDAEGNEFNLKDDPDIWRFITDIQDETHRFAIEYNRKLTEKRYKKSPLDDIKGVGEKRKMSLLRKFGSVKALREAEVAEIARVDNIGEKTARAIKEALCSEVKNK